MPYNDDKRQGSLVRPRWIEPEVRELDVRETALRPGVGPDGNTRWSDCTLS